MKKGFVWVCLMLVVFSLKAQVEEWNQPEFQRDVSYRCSLVEVQSLGLFNNDEEGWKSLTSGKLSLSDGKELNDHAQEGSHSLAVSVTNEPANLWKGIYKDFENHLDFSHQELFSFSILASSARPARRDYVRLRLSDGKQSFDCLSEIIPSLWRTVIFDISGCPFRDRIRRIEIALRNESDALWDDCRFLLDNVKVGRPLDLQFSIPGSSNCFRTNNGKIDESEDALKYTFKGKAALQTTALKNSRNSIYNPDLEEYNTFFLVLGNESDVSRVRLYYKIKDNDEWSKSQSKVFRVLPHSGLKAYYVNLSDVPAKGQLTGFRLEAEDGTGGCWLLDGVRFLKEQPIETYVGSISSCKASKKRLSIKGTILPEYLSRYPRLAIYEAPLYQQEATQTVEQLSGWKKEGQEDVTIKRSNELSGYTKIYEGAATTRFNLRDLPNKSSYGKISLLSSRLLAVVMNERGEYMKVAPYFYVENWRDFGNNPFHFKLSGATYNVLDFGAKGDGFTDDTEAINRVLKTCSQKGGGHVVLPGSEEPYGRRYVATNIQLQSNVELHLEQGAVIWQSADSRHYRYQIYYGHDIDIPGVPWTHCLYVNRPLIEGSNLKHVKLTGPGTIRMNAPYTINPDWGHYARVCTDCLHLLPLGIVDSEDIEISDIDIVRSNNYHTYFHNDHNLFIGNVKMYDVKCVSTDGLSFGQGTEHVFVNRAILHSNDDGIVLSTSYGDPRGTISPWRYNNPEADHSIRHLKVVHSSICSTHGAGKAVSVIPWGTTNPDQQKQELDDIEVTDCMLIGGYSVGTWPDNPFDGKPFTNTETDDYSPVKNFYIHDNVYADPCDLLCVHPTNFRGDTGIHSASEFQNGDFKLGSSYWTMKGNAGVHNHEGFVKSGGRLCEGLYLEKGSYRFSAQIKGKGNLVIRRSSDGKMIAKKSFKTADWQEESLNVSLSVTDDYFVGLEGGSALVKNCLFAVR